MPHSSMYAAIHEEVRQAFERSMNSPVLVAVTGWQVGFRKVSHTHALQQLTGMSLASAKAATDAVLDGRPVQVLVHGPVAAAKLAAALRELGALVQLPSEA